MKNEKLLKEAGKNIQDCADIVYAFIFGSYLNKLRPESDVDFLISSRLDFDKKVDLESKLSQLFKRKVDIVFYEDAPVELVLKAFSTGTALVVRNDTKLKEDYYKAFYAYENARNLRRIKEKRLKRRYSNG